MVQIELNTKQGMQKAAQAELKASKVRAALTQIENDLGSIETDLAALPSATTAELKTILGNVLQIQRRSLRRERAIIRYLARD